MPAPNTYSGRPGRESIGPSFNVTGASNETPIEITTSAVHGLVTGEYVGIQGVKGNKTANGNWYIEVTASDKFKIYAAWSAGAPATPVAGSGAYTTGGIGTSGGFANIVTLPTDGLDSVDAASVNVPFEGNFDREAWLSRAIGAYKIGSIDHKETATAPVTNWHSITANVGTPDEVQIWDEGTDGVINVPPGAKVEVEFNGTISTSATNGLASYITVQLCDYDNGSIVLFESPKRALPVSHICQLTHKVMLENSAAFSKQINVFLEAEEIGGLNVTGAQYWGAYNLIIKVFPAVPQ